MSRIRFDGQVVLVTGAGRGLGAAYARGFAARGASVVVHDAGVEADGSGGDHGPADGVAAEITLAGGTAAACHENLEVESACLAAVDFALERFGRLDVVVHNAGLVTTWGNPWFPHGPPPSEPSLPPLPQRSRPFVLSGPPLPLVTGPPAGQSPAPAAIRSDPTWVSELEPEQVVPGVLFLASDRCTLSGKVLEAAGGEFDVARWASSECKRTIPERVERKPASEQCLKRPSRRRQELEIEGLINV